VMILSDVRSVASESQDIRWLSRTNETYTEKDGIRPSSSPSSFCEKPIVALVAIHDVLRKAASIVKRSSSWFLEDSTRPIITYPSTGNKNLHGHHRKSGRGLLQR
jgi:hypothetical protein